MYFTVQVTPKHVVKACRRRTAAGSEKARVALDNADAYCRAKARPMLDGERHIHDAMARACTPMPLTDAPPVVMLAISPRTRSRAEERRRFKKHSEFLRICDAIAGYRRMAGNHEKAIKNLQAERRLLLQ